MISLLLRYIAAYSSKREEWLVAIKPERLNFFQRISSPVLSEKKVLNLGDGPVLMRIQVRSIGEVGPSNQYIVPEFALVPFRRQDSELSFLTKDVSIVPEFALVPFRRQIKTIFSDKTVKERFVLSM